MLGCVRLTGGVRVGARGDEGSSRARITEVQESEVLPLPFTCFLKTSTTLPISFE